MIDTIPLKLDLWVHNNPKVSNFLRAVLDCVYYGISDKTDILTLWYISGGKNTIKNVSVSNVLRVGRVFKKLNDYFAETILMVKKISII